MPAHLEGSAKPVRKVGTICYSLYGKLKAALFPNALSAMVSVCFLFIYYLKNSRLIFDLQKSQSLMPIFR
jgi:hypothetical protein